MASSVPRTETKSSGSALSAFHLAPISCVVLSSPMWLLGDQPSSNSHSLVRQGQDKYNENSHLEKEGDIQATGFL